MRLILTLILGLWWLPALTVGASSEEEVIQEYRRRFAVLEQDSSLESLQDRTAWPRHDLLASYLELELMLHPDQPASIEQLDSFVRQWPNHPQGDRVLKVLEKRLVDIGGERAENWFVQHPPKSQSARQLRLGGLLRAERGDDALALWRELYREGAESHLKIGQEHPFQSRLTQADHEARARSLAGRDVNSLAAVLRQLPEARQGFFRALDAARRGDGQFPAVLTGLTLTQPERREVWRERFDLLQKQGAVSRMQEWLVGSQGAELAVEDRQKWRYWLGRQLIFSKQEYRSALLILEENVREKGGALEDSAWLAGWSAFNLGERGRAGELFRRMAREGVTPAGRAQGGYWAARLTDNPSERSVLLEGASRHLDTLHGQLAHEELRGSLPKLTDPDPVCPDQGTSPKITEADLEVPKLLHAVGREWYAGPEIMRLGERVGLNSEERLCLAIRFGVAELALKLASELHRKERTFWRGLFPMPRWMPDGGWQLSQALIWATSRQESQFFPRAESSAKAFGVMQLMPETARSEARLSRFPEATRMRLQTPGYNMALGQAYMRRMLKQFDGDVVLALVGYNAGPGRARQWREERLHKDPMTFIEGIPIAETRNYVKKVLTGMGVYQLLLTGSASIQADMAVGGPGEAVLAPISMP
ncbi:MAG: lytic transglycosylase domain-containing protein [Magnetococcales bacterium]|nr:lytic transglycosylase domain-containing protein [Magnetococcales bacterium]NGZ05321.1 lytic transglycosylase domain-containing protein [Magnetococcales bacterium]